MQSRRRSSTPIPAAALRPMYILYIYIYKLLLIKKYLIYNYIFIIYIIIINKYIILTFSNWCSMC